MSERFCMRRASPDPLDPQGISFTLREKDACGKPARFDAQGMWMCADHWDEWCAAFPGSDDEPLPA
jgi:hypothetical protein